MMQLALLQTPSLWGGKSVHGAAVERMNRSKRSCVLKRAGMLKAPTAVTKTLNLPERTTATTTTTRQHQRIAEGDKRTAACPGP